MAFYDAPLRSLAPQLDGDTNGRARLSSLSSCGEDARAYRADARFIALMAQLHLVEFWDAAGWPDLCARSGTQIVCR
jgi:hypothetical protein